MGFHHVALAARDTATMHRFYSEVMGFELVKVVVSPTPDGGWSKHYFYDTTAGSTDAASTRGDATSNGSVDGGMMAFWEIHDSTIGDDYPVNLNDGIGLPWWVNHIAFDAPTMADLERHRERWRAHGHTVLQMNHDFCVSIYIRDPSGNMVEFCHTLRPFTPEELAHARATIGASAPEIDKQDPQPVLYPPTPADELASAR